jgi:hypothetical protein
MTTAAALAVHIFVHAAPTGDRRHQRKRDGPRGAARNIVSRHCGFR